MKSSPSEPGLNVRMRKSIKIKEYKIAKRMTLSKGLNGVNRQA